MPFSRAILHVDMDAFFASVEVLDNPDLAGKPVVVGHDGPRGVVAAASYEARKFGCHSAQPMAIAKRLCPDLIICRGSGARYRELSDQVFAIFHESAPLVQPMSIDEAFLDVTGVQQPSPDPVVIASNIKQRVFKETGLTCSVGVAPNKFLAKLGSARNKPDGMTVILPEEVDAFLLATPIDALWGVGQSTRERFARLGVYSVADMRELGVERLNKHFGKLGEHFYKLCRGMDDRPVTTDREAKSISHEHTFPVDVANRDELRRVLSEEVEQVARRLRKQEKFAASVTVKLRYGNFETITRSCTLHEPTHQTARFQRAAMGLFDLWARNAFKPVRLIGMGVSQLTQSAGQLGLFSADEDEKQQRLDQAADTVANRFGKHAIHRGSAISRRPEEDGGSFSPARSQ